MSSRERHIRLGQVADLREKRGELAKKFTRYRQDVFEYLYPENPLDPVSSCQVDLAESAMRELVKVVAEYEQLTAAIKELED